MKNMRILVVFSVVAFLFATSVAWAVVVPAPPNAPSWWKIPGDPLDGATRTQYHGFTGNPNDDTFGTYNGFIPDLGDVWTFDFGPNHLTPTFNTAIPDGLPTIAYGDGIGFEAIPLPGDFIKTMGNRENERKIKQFYAGILWFDASPTMNSTLDIEVYADAEVTGTQYTIVQPDSGWRFTYVTGVIIPQPSHEHFEVDFGATGDVYVDSFWAGTHCVPEPSTIAMMLFGGLGVVGGVIRKIRR
jgi:hypothetical protein